MGGSTTTYHCLFNPRLPNTLLGGMTGPQKHTKQTTVHLRRYAWKPIGHPRPLFSARVPTDQVLTPKRPLGFCKLSVVEAPLLRSGLMGEELVVKRSGANYNDPSLE